MNKTTIASAGLMCLALAEFGAAESRYPINPDTPPATVPATIQTEWTDVTVTVYNPTAAQCDSTPLITADLSRIDTTALKLKKLRWCAVSRDLLDAHTYGDTIYLDLGPDHWATGPWVIRDTMAKRWANRVDLLTWNDRRGKWSGKIITTKN